MKKVLIVDDEIDLCLLIRNTLIKKNYEVYIAHNLSDGVKKLSIFKPDSLLLDNNLPDGKGWNIAKDIKSMYPQMNITLISAHHVGTDLEESLDDSVTVLEKPLSLQDIERYI